ncbi:tyrosine-type recombinase/integrase [Paenibacillus sp. FSL R5-0766]|uniref:tyrosine-type recombinase/integrase n=1 Tax=unclassified Paenibacillus TaxID=185978 RepID=UPI0009FB2431|nr:tyrosine-type recombinase/integrase [Paenibacillus sp. FSL R5-0765]
MDKDITIHGLRHTHAVMMLESGASMKEVQERLGHASIEVTSDIYAHITEVIEARSIDKYSSYMDYPEE